MVRKVVPVKKKGMVSFMGYFKKVSSYEDLKEQYRRLLKKNHPDNGGDGSIMQEINCEYEALFRIWKQKKVQETGEEVTETAESVRMHFYTEYGWAGSRYDSSLSTTDIAKIIRCYCKEKYPTWKFSVTSKYFSGGSEINIALMEAPIDIFDREYFKLPQNTEYRRCEGYRMDCWRFDEMSEAGEYYMQLHSIRARDDSPWFNDIGYQVMYDVFSFMQSYNYDDSDSMADYFSCNFYYSIGIGKWNKGMRIVPKTARIQKENKTPSVEHDQEAGAYEIRQTEHTKTGAKIWTVRIRRKLEREEYLREQEHMKQFGGYYSRYVRAFVFDHDPTSELAAV